MGKVDVAQPVGKNGRQDKETEKKYWHDNEDPLSMCGTRHLRKTRWNRARTYCKNAMSFRRSVRFFTHGDGSPLVTTMTGDETLGAVGTFNPDTM
jgi:hypothetical protein